MPAVGSGSALVARAAHRTPHTDEIGANYRSTGPLSGRCATDGCWAAEPPAPLPALQSYADPCHGPVAVCEPGTASGPGRPSLVPTEVRKGFTRTGDDVYMPPPIASSPAC
ncbi:hypothetical protein LK06_000625 [Streptomyces pluripotens]|nr:hypothetical protein LK06_000625 [Streptomyces pluripotens]